METITTASEASLQFMRQLVQQYINRQQLVALAMLEVHPTPLKTMGSHVLGVEIAPYLDKWYEKIAINPNWQGGIWRYSWRHWARGVGCELVHINTGEPIEWDVPDLMAFDEIWFWNHLSWRISNSKPQQWQHYYDQLYSLYDVLKARGDIVTTQSGKMKFATHLNITDPSSDIPEKMRF